MFDADHWLRPGRGGTTNVAASAGALKVPHSRGAAHPRRRPSKAPVIGACHLRFDAVMSGPPHSEAAAAIHQSGSVEIQEQYDSDSADAVITPRLHFVHGEDRRDRLDFQYDLLGRDNVRLAAVTDLLAHVEHRMEACRTNATPARRSSTHGHCS
ncbi:MAG TPA: hypothetical protein VMB34_13640 [Acetobacteraceae bacterium]|nr:hypothetical protein [Acetobacteraceae bacterium]